MDTQAVMLPIVEFSNEEQMKDCLKEWQSRLFLDDWIIGIKLVDRFEIDGDSGQVKFNLTGHNATIYIAKLDNVSENSIEKACHEQILVHELLHLKYNWLEPADTYEGRYLDEVEHMLLEQMANSLIMAKYPITFKWFENH